MKNTIEIRTTAPGLLLLGALLAFSGCSLEAPDDPSGQINAPGLEDAGARYVAVGNSLTAGFMDGGLVQSGQMYSYPNLIAAQLGLSSTQFTQPWIAAPGIGTSTPSSPANVAGVLYFTGTGISVLGETPRTAIQSSLLLAATQPTQYHNLGVPGATLRDGMSAYNSTTSSAALAGGTPNAYFDFINRASLFGNRVVESGYPTPTGTVPVTYQSASQFYQAVAKGGALTTMWLGNNDVLGPAMSGEPAAGFGPAGAADFQARYTALLSMLAGGLSQRNNGLKPTIIVANIPSVSSTPYFIPRAAFEFAVGGPWPGGYAESDATYVLFPALSWATPANAGSPVPATLTLDAAESADVATAVATYNTIIAGVRSAVNASGIAKVGLVDANALLGSLADSERTHFLFLVGGLGIEGAAATTLFSLDGVHPNSRGYGVLANAFIDAINEIDGTTIPHVDVDAITWDPTYGRTPIPGKAAFRVDERAAAAMTAIFD